MSRTKKKKRKKGRWIAIGLVVVLVVGGVILKAMRGKKQEEVEIVKVKRGTVTDRLTETGTIELVRTVDVKSSMSGEIKTLSAEEGDDVREGQLLAVVEPDPNQTLLLYNKRASVDRARIDLGQKEKELERRRKLSLKDLVSKEELEQMENLVKLARNAYQLSRLELEMLETRANIAQSASTDGSPELADVRITAPIAGIITQREVEIGEMVVSGISSMMAGTTLFQIGDPSRMIIRSEISEVDVGRIAPGQDVEIVADSYPDTTYRGRVRRVAPVGRRSQNRGIVVFDTEIEILDREPRLRQGMSCDIDIIFHRRQDVLYLPVEAFFEVFEEDVEDAKGRKGMPVAYLKEGDDFLEREVKLGLESSSRAQIVEGLSLDDEVAADAEKMRTKKEQERKQREKEQESEGAETEETEQDHDRS